MSEELNASERAFAGLNDKPTPKPTTVAESKYFYQRYESRKLNVGAHSDQAEHILAFRGAPIPPSLWRRARARFNTYRYLLKRRGK